MIYILLREDGSVVSVATIQGKGYTAYDGTLPPRPSVAEGEPEPRLMLVDGALVWQVGKTRAEVEAERKIAYRDRVDPITSEISRLRDMGGTDAEIAEAMARRASEVARIKRELPYPEDDQ